MESAENRNATLCRADLPITKRLPQKYRVQTVTRRDEVIPPYGSNPDKSHRRFLIHPTGTRCRALICAEIEREAIPKRRRSAPDDRAVLIASLVFSCEAALSSQRKIRGSRKRGYKKPAQGVLYPLLQRAGCRSAAFPRRRVAARPRTPQRANPGCRSAAFPRLLRQGRRNGGTVSAQPRRGGGTAQPRRFLSR